MTDTEFKVGDLFFNESGYLGYLSDKDGVFIKEFGIIYDFDIGEWPECETLAKIYWQTTQKIKIYYVSTVEERVYALKTWTHYPSETK
jgi:hypothetical protein